MAYPGPRTPSDYDRAAAADHAPLRLSAADIAETISVPQVLDLLAEGFRTVGVRTPRAVAESSSPRARLRGRLPEIPASTVRIDVRMSGSGARSTVRLHDSTTDALLAVLDGASVTAWRTGLAAALATHTLTDPAVTTLGFIGSGASARAASVGLRHLRRWERIVATDDDPGLSAESALDATTIVAEAGAVVLAATPRPPRLRPTDVRAGRHLTLLGAERTSGWRALSALLVGSRLVVDDVDAAMTEGALGAVGLNAGHCDGTLGQVLRGEIAASRPDQRSVYVAAGLPWQDLAVAWAVYLSAGRQVAGVAG